jgi:hypothetical protein
VVVVAIDADEAGPQVPPRLGRQAAATCGSGDRRRRGRQRRSGRRRRRLDDDEDDVTKDDFGDEDVDEPRTTTREMITKICRGPWPQGV